MVRKRWFGICWKVLNKRSGCSTKIVVMMETFEEWLGYGKSWRVERRMMVRDDWGEKRVESLTVTFTTPSSGSCPHDGEGMVNGGKKKLRGDSSSFRSSLLSSHHSSLICVFYHSSFLSLLQLLSSSLVTRSFFHPFIPLYYPLIRFGVPTNPINPKPKFHKAEKIWSGSNPLIRLEFW